jgi:hypothetical protein
VAAAIVAAASVCSGVRSSLRAGKHAGVIYQQRVAACNLCSCSCPA